MGHFAGHEAIGINTFLVSSRFIDQAQFFYERKSMVCVEGSGTGQQMTEAGPAAPDLTNTIAKCLCTRSWNESLLLTTAIV